MAHLPALGGSRLTLSKQALVGSIGNTTFKGGNVRIGKQISAGLARALPDYQFMGKAKLPIKVGRGRGITIHASPASHPAEHPSPLAWHDRPFPCPPY